MPLICLSGFPLDEECWDLCPDLSPFQNLSLRPRACPSGAKYNGRRVPPEGSMRLLSAQALPLPMALPLYWNVYGPRRFSLRTISSLDQNAGVCHLWTKWTCNSTSSGVRPGNPPPLQDYDLGWRFHTGKAINSTHSNPSRPAEFMCPGVEELNSSMSHAECRRGTR